ncbi:hypothetical protein NP493_2318g00017 [Ridgeia piscesae]|uniref:Uncharacterized protein n=1 Tax=Ridgeia piscesae TaxID=27915 RepID=A0AAD9JI21_RIDPI|nr:hypothetical protein NP493_2318g00017 [Ridgeia piscesae]
MCSWLFNNVSFLSYFIKLTSSALHVFRCHIRRKMATGSHSDESIVNLNGVDICSSGLRNFAGLTGALLLVGIVANA